MKFPILFIIEKLLTKAKKKFLQEIWKLLFFRVEIVYG